MTINNNSVEQINVALLDLEGKVKKIDLSKNFGELNNEVENLKQAVSETKLGLNSGTTYDISISGNASTATHAISSDSANTANSAGTANSAINDSEGNNIFLTYAKKSELPTEFPISVDKGGTGGITTSEARYNLLSDISDLDSDPSDGTLFVMKNTSPTSTNGTLFTRTGAHLWNWIKGKISSILGLTETSYGGKSDSADKDGDGNTISSTYLKKSDLINLIYPVGSVYLSVNNVSPQTFLGGTWTQVSSGRVLQGADSSHAGGTTINAGLPNITGSIWWNNTWKGGGADGVFSRSTTSMGGYSGSGTDEYSKYTLDASRGGADAIYGKSTTVQPPAFVVYIWKRTA